MEQRRRRLGRRNFQAESRNDACPRRMPIGMRPMRCTSCRLRGQPRCRSSSEIWYRCEKQADQFVTASVLNDRRGLNSSMGPAPRCSKVGLNYRLQYRTVLVAHMATNHGGPKQYKKTCLIAHTSTKNAKFWTSLGVHLIGSEGI